MNNLNNILKLESNVIDESITNKNILKSTEGEKVTNEENANDHINNITKNILERIKKRKVS